MHLINELVFVPYNILSEAHVLSKEHYMPVQSPLKTYQFIMWLGIRERGVVAQLLKEPLSSDTSRNSILLSHEKKHMESILLIKSISVLTVRNMNHIQGHMQCPKLRSSLHMM